MVDVRQSSGAPRGADRAAAAAGVPVLVRPIIHADLPWMVPIFKQRYSNAFDAEESLRWMTNVVLPAPHVFYAIRSENAFLIALLTFPPWIPERRDAYVVVVATAPGHIW